MGTRLTRLLGRGAPSRLRRLPGRKRTPCGLELRRCSGVLTQAEVPIQTLIRATGRSSSPTTRSADRGAVSRIPLIDPLTARPGRGPGENFLYSEAASQTRTWITRERRSILWSVHGADFQMRRPG